MRTRRTAGHTLVMCCLFALSTPAIAQSQVEAMCFLEGIEPEREDNLMGHKVEAEVRCAAADRMVVDVASFDLKLLDGDQDLIAAGAAWKEAHLESNPEDDFFSSEPTNAISVSETGRERSIQLRAHTHALPETGVVRIEGNVDLMVEADCVGRDAVKPITLRTTVGSLRAATNDSTDSTLFLPSGDTIEITEQGTHGDSPMLAIAGSGSYVGVVDPPEGVQEIVFFGKKRLVVGPDIDVDTTVRLQICPTETIQVPVDIEAAI